jgi:hypothetical protein
MSTFDDASLVMIPSGYKTSKVYSVKPTDGTGDLTFTRSNDTASRIGPDGLIEKVRTNLLTYSQDFTATGGWVALFGATITPTANYGTAPDGTTTSTRIVFTGASQIYSKTISGLTGNIGVFSLWIKGTAGETIAITYGGASDKLVTLGSGWTRFNTDGNSASNDTIYINTFLSATALDIEVWGGQVEFGDIATDYIATTTAAVSVGPVANVPRLDYLGSSCPRLLLEPQRTNSLFYSEQFDNAAWTKLAGVSLSANQSLSPDGYTNADHITWSASGITTQLYQVNSTSGTSQTLSLFIKYISGSGTGLRLSIGSNIPYGINLEFSNGGATLTGVEGINVTSTKIEPYGNNWFRVSFVAAYAGASTEYNLYRYSGTGTDVYAIWGAQLESATSYATSYIPTLGAAVTRGADLALKTGISSLIGSTEGTIFFDLPPTTFSNTISTYVLIELAGNIGAGYVHLYKESGLKEARLSVKNGATLQCDLPFALSDNTPYKIAGVYKNNRFELYVNGVLRASDYSGTLAAITMDKIQVAGDSFNANSQIATNQVLLFKTALTQAQCEQLTA